MNKEIAEFMAHKFFNGMQKEVLDAMFAKKYLISNEGRKETTEEERTRLVEFLDALK